MVNPNALPSELTIYNENLLWKNIGYFTLEDGHLNLYGFSDFKDYKYLLAQSVDDNGEDIVLLMPANEDGEVMSFPIEDEFFQKSIFKQFLLKHDAIDCLFVKIFGCYFQCKDLRTSPIED